MSLNSFILPVHFETVIGRKQTLTKNEDRNISVFVEPIHTNIYQTNQTKKENISCQTKKEIMKIYANAHHEENLSNTYAIENPSNVKLTIYDANKQQIEQITLDDNNKENVGVYFYDYILPDDKQEIIFEFSGACNNKPILVRDSVKIQFN